MLKIQTLVVLSSTLNVSKWVGYQLKMSLKQIWFGSTIYSITPQRNEIRLDHHNLILIPLYHYLIHENIWRKLYTPSLGPYNSKVHTPNTQNIFYLEISKPCDYHHMHFKLTLIQKSGTNDSHHMLTLIWQDGQKPVDWHVMVTVFWKEVSQPMRFITYWLSSEKRIS